MEWGVIADGVVHGNVGADAWKDQADGVYSLDLEALFPYKENGAAYVLIEAGGGEGVDGRIATFSGFCGHSWGGDSDFEVSEVWYEHQWFDSHLRGRIGKIDLTTDFDANAYANCEHEQFLSNGFINNLAAEIPENAFGGMLWLEPSENLAFGAGCQSNNDWDDVFHDGFGILELDWKPLFFEHQGNYRFYGWASAHRSVYDEESQEVAAGYTNYGWGFSFDQELSGHFSLWMRYGSQCNAEFNAFKTHATFGVQLMSFGARTEDAVGIAYGVAGLADAYAETIENAEDERHIELYYRVNLNRFISMTPNLQWVENPEGDAARGGVRVFGLRGTLKM